MNKQLLKALAISVFCFVILSSTVILFADDAKTTTDDGILVIESEDGNFRYQLDGRVYLDWALMDDDDAIVDLHSGSEVRRMRLAFKTTIWKNWAAELDGRRMVIIG